MNEEQEPMKAKEVASLDQALAVIMEVAKHSAAIYKQFIAEGIDPQVALYLTTEITKSLLSKSK